MASSHHQMSSGLLRYRSAPTSLFDEALSPEAESIFARFLSSPSDLPAAAAAAAQRNPHFPPPQPPQEEMMYSQMAAAMEADEKSAGGNLIRQSSSPAGLFAHLNVDDNGTSSGGLRLRSQLSRQSSLMSQISEEMENGSIDDDGGYAMGGGSWEQPHLLSSDDAFGLMSIKRRRGGGLAQQFSLPRTSSEMMAATGKFLQFQDSVPCRIRAKRGCATHPRSIAERVRRTRISERMRKLQELVPNMDKQTNTADMLDLAVDYIKDLQKQVKTITSSRARCVCSSSRQKQHTNPTA